jgi:hypothetical protein
MNTQFEDTIPVEACSATSRRSLPSISEESFPLLGRRSRRKGGSGGGGGSSAAAAASSSPGAALSLGAYDMIGLFVISVTLQLLAVIIWAIEHFTGKQFSELCGCASDEEKAPAPRDHSSNLLVYSSHNLPSQDYGHHWTTTGATAPMAAKEMGVLYEPPPFEAPLPSSREGPRLRLSSPVTMQSMDPAGPSHLLPAPYRRQSPETMAQYASGGPAAMAFPHGVL